MKLMLSILLTITMLKASGSNRERLNDIFQYFQNKYQIHNIEDLNRKKSFTSKNNSNLNSVLNPSDIVGNWEMANMTQKILVTVDSTQIIPTMGSLNGMEVSNGGITVFNDSLSTVLTYMSIGDSSDVDSTMIESMLFMNFDFFSLFAIIFGIDIGIENPMIITLDSGYVMAADLSDTTGDYYSGTYMAPVDTNQVTVDMENFTFSFDNFVMNNYDSTSTLNVSGALSPQTYQIDAGVETELSIPAMLADSMNEQSEDIYVSFYENGSGLSVETYEDYYETDIDSSSISWAALNDSLFITFYDSYYSDSSETDTFAYSFYNDTLVLEQSIDPCFDDGYYYYFDSYDECFASTELGMYAYGLTGISDLKQNMQIHFVQYDAVSTISESLTPNRHNLYPAFPNPFNPVTTIGYSLSHGEHINLGIYDLKGRKIKTLINGKQSSGYYEVKWNATNDLGEAVSGGVYLYKIQVGQISETKKIILLK